MFEAPIPGQSLTTEPKNSPWENPSEISDLGDVIKYYIDKLSKEEVMDDIVALLDLDVPLVPLVEGLYMKGVMGGVHTVDSGILAAPAMHAFISSAAEQQGINIKEEAGDADRRAEEKEKERFIALTMKYMETVEEEDAGTDLLETIAQDFEDAPESDMMDIEMSDEVEEPVETLEEEPAPTGLMSKGL